MAGVNEGACAKQRVVAVIVHPDGQITTGENRCLTAQPVCPRVLKKCKTGEGYELCHKVCQQIGHAEEVAIMKAGKKELKGAILFMFGHTYCCDNCVAAMKAAGLAGYYYINQEGRLTGKELW